MSTPAAPRRTHRPPPSPSRKRTCATKRRRTAAYEQPRFKVHVRDADKPNPARSNVNLGSPLPSITLSLHPPPLPQPPTTAAPVAPVLTIAHVAATSTVIAAASPSQLSVWAVHDTYPPPIPSPDPTTPFSHLLSQYPAPPDHHITALALSPDAAALALAVQPSSPTLANHPAAVVVLHPRTSTRLLRIALPSFLSFTPFPNPARETNLTLAFVTASQVSSSPSPPLDRAADLPPHLRYLFHRHATADTSTDQPSSITAECPVARFALAVAAANGVAAHYRFARGYTRLFQYATIDPVDLFHSDTPLRMSAASLLPAPPCNLTPHDHVLSDNGHEDRLLAFCGERGVALFEGALPTHKLSEHTFRPLAVCAALRKPNGALAVVLLVARDKEPERKRHRGKGAAASDASERQVAWAFKSTQDAWRFVPVQGLTDADVRDVKVMRDVGNSLSALVFGSKGNVLRYAITVQKNGAFRVVSSATSDSLRRLLSRGILDVNSALVRRGDRLVAIGASDLKVVVSAAACAGSGLV